LRGPFIYVFIILAIHLVVYFNQQISFSTRLWSVFLRFSLRSIFTLLIVLEIHLLIQNTQRMPIYEVHVNVRRLLILQGGKGCVYSVRIFKRLIRVHVFRCDLYLDQSDHYHYTCMARNHYLLLSTVSSIPFTNLHIISDFQFHVLARVNLITISNFHHKCTCYIQSSSHNIIKVTLV